MKPLRHVVAVGIRMSLSEEKANPIRESLAANIPVLCTLATAAAGELTEKEDLDLEHVVLGNTLLQVIAMLQITNMSEEEISRLVRLQLDSGREPSARRFDA